MKSVRIGRDLEHITISLGDSPRDPDSDKQLAKRGYYDSPLADFAAPTGESLQS
jgi:hypothetical protein